MVWENWFRVVAMSICSLAPPAMSKIGLNMNGETTQKFSSKNSVKTIGFYANGFGNGMNAKKCNVRT